MKSLLLTFVILTNASSVALASSCPEISGQWVVEKCGKSDQRNFPGVNKVDEKSEYATDFGGVSYMISSQFISFSSAPGYPLQIEGDDQCHQYQISHFDTYNQQYVVQLLPLQAQGKWKFNGSDHQIEHYATNWESGGTVISQKGKTRSSSHLILSADGESMRVENREQFKGAFLVFPGHSTQINYCDFRKVQ